MRIHSGYDVLNLFGISAQASALTKKASTSLAVALMGAFLIVACLGLVLGSITRAWSSSSQASASTFLETEAVAFIPGQFVSSEIAKGYLGNYR